MVNQKPESLKYDAFISYRHGGLDGLVAARLHKLLEAYVIPRAIARKAGKKKLKRVFRDREELPTSANLSDSINDALENSAFLLLVCSPRTCESRWVMREVEQFAALRGKDKIIALLVSGEPDESFPPGLREREVGGKTVFVEPLAADIRAASWKRSLKLLNEEKLRLLAPILGCAFDDLRRRHLRRRLRRTVTAAGAVLSVSLSFTLFSLWQYLQIDRQMQLKLENQSHVLAEYSERELENGDPDVAALLALAALPADPVKPERPLVAAAEKALADALGVYDLSDGFRPYKTVSLAAAPSQLILSPGETRAAAVSSFTLTVFSPVSGQPQAELPTAPTVLAGARFLSEDVIVFAGADGLEAYDLRVGRTLWRRGAASAVAVSADAAVVAAVYEDESAASLYAPDGRSLGRIDFGGRVMRVPVEGAFLNPRDAVFALDHGGDRLAVSFADGSLSVFETAGGGETVVCPPSGASHFAGGFTGEMLAFAMVENDPYLASYTVYDAAAARQITRFTSETSHFVPCGEGEGLYAAFEEQVLAIDPQSGEPAVLFTAGGQVETLRRRGEVFLACESGGAYRFAAGDGGGKAAVWPSDYVCHFAALGERFALTGSYDAETVRILRKEDGGAEEILRYAADYQFSEAKIQPELGRAVFYSHTGLRLCGLDGTLAAEILFPRPLEVLDTQYDRKSGNVAVLYESEFRLYSGRDGALLLEEFGKKGVKSVLYTEFGVSVLKADGTVWLYDLASGAALAAESVGADADRALPLDDGPALLTARAGRVFFAGRDLGGGDLIGAGKTGPDEYGFAVADGTEGRVYFVRGGVLSEGFVFPAQGRAEAYFTGGYVFISPPRGGAAAYTREGALVRLFTEKGYLAETEALGDFIAAGYVSAAGDRYAFLLNPVTLETVAELPGYLGELDAGAAVFDDGEGSLRRGKLYSLQELMDAAEARLGDRELTAAEAEKFRTG
ncbi:MAG: toll/interleukin-1 receptor domain-containing protein [Gracilibacteraceae bacterium]|jgi:hypothetical protein|nr:toll/interleukin-1 receptor domain-containing protein [Gracilibacteraceae bacterium]